MIESPTVWIAGTGCVIIALAIPLLLRRVPPNHFYGLRIPATLQDEQVWYAANAASGRDMLVLGLLVLLMAVVRPWFAWRADTYLLGWSMAVAVGMIVLAFVGWARANRMLRERQREPGPR